MSLDTLGISPEQKAAVEKIRTDLHARMEPARSAEQKLINTLTEGLAAGNVDAAGVDAAIAQVASAATAVHDASAEAVNELHALLTPPERAALVDKVEAHWAVWQKANSLKPDPAHGHLATLAKELGLTQDQVDKVRASLDERLKAVPPLEPQEIATHLRAFGDAFRSEKFDSKVLTTANGANSHLAGWGAARLAHFVQALSPVLTPDQRTKFAQRLREHAAYNPNDRGES
jgi:Spy/CpxP family protein refolding chaperone